MNLGSEPLRQPRRIADINPVERNPMPMVEFRRDFNCYAALAGFVLIPTIWRNLQGSAKFCLCNAEGLPGAYQAFRDDFYIIWHSGSLRSRNRHNPLPMREPLTSSRFVNYVWVHARNGRKRH